MSRVAPQQWSELHADEAVRVVAYDVVPSKFPNGFGTGARTIDFDPPSIFETTISGGMFNAQKWCYTSEANALDGHARLVAAVRASESL